MPSFSELEQLAEVVSRNKVKNIQVLGNPNTSNSRTETFYRALTEKKFKNDAEAAAHFYGKSSDYPAYYMLKGRVFERMINTIFFIDIKRHNFSSNSHFDSNFTL